MAHISQVSQTVVCRDCLYRADEEWASNSDRMRIMNNGIVTCNGCHSGLGSVNLDGEIEWYDDAVMFGD